MKSAGKARSNGLYRHIRTSKEIIRNLLNDFFKILIGVQYEPEGAKAPAWLSYYFSIKWLTPFYPANSSQAAGSGEKCMDLRFLRLRRWLLKQQPNKTVFNRFIEN